MENHSMELSKQLFTFFKCAVPLVSVEDFFGGLFWSDEIWPFFQASPRFGEGFQAKLKSRLESKRIETLLGKQMFKAFKWRLLGQRR